MSTTVIATAIKMLESLPEAAQREVVERMREYVAELQDERAWDARFQKTQSRLMAEARRVKDEIARGEAESLDVEKL